MKQLRIATLGDWKGYYSAFLYGTMEGSILNGAWFRAIDIFTPDIASIESQIKFFNPQIIFCHCIFNEGSPFNREQLHGMLRRIKKSGVKILYHQGDARTEPRFPHDISDFVSGALINHKLHEPFVNTWKIPAIYWPYSCFVQKEIPDFKDDRFVCDVSFTGSLSDKQGHVHYERTQFVNALKNQTKLNIKVFPNSEVQNTRFFTPEMCESAFVQLGVQMASHIPGYIDVRPFQYIGAGGLYFHDSELGCFIPENHYIMYEKGSVASFMEKFEYYSEHKEQAKTIRYKGWGFAQSNHSTKIRVAEAIEFAGTL